MYRTGKALKALLGRGYPDDHFRRQVEFMWRTRTRAGSSTATRTTHKVVDCFYPLDRLADAVRLELPLAPWGRGGMDASPLSASQARGLTLSTNPSPPSASQATTARRRLQHSPMCKLALKQVANS